MCRENEYSSRKKKKKNKVVLNRSQDLRDQSSKTPTQNISGERLIKALDSLTQSNAKVGSCMSRLPTSDRSGNGVAIADPPDTDEFCAIV